jgi:hypothetical protein|tara:strand:+ start:552 stop:785 length:234 start_codon:yes stop_codon:yes gene_type:complete
MKNQTLPKQYEGKIKIYDEGAVVQNRFGGASIELNALELSIYDYLMGCESMEDWKGLRVGLDWFIQNNSDAYMVLLD